MSKPDSPEAAMLTRLYLLEDQMRDLERRHQVTARMVDRLVGTVPLTATEKFSNAKLNVTDASAAEQASCAHEWVLGWWFHEGSPQPFICRLCLAEKTKAAVLKPNSLHPPDEYTDLKRRKLGKKACCCAEGVLHCPGCFTRAYEELVKEPADANPE